MSIDQLVIADTVTMADSVGPGFRAHVNFPYLQQRHDGTLVANYAAGQTQSGLSFGKQAISSDDGQTWSASTSIVDGGQIQIIKPPGEFSRGFSVGFSTGSPAGQTSWSNSSFTSNDGGTTWVQGVSNYDTAGVPYTVVSGSFGDVIDDGGGRWLMPAFGTRPGAATFENILFESHDLGVNWTRVSTISPFIGGPNLMMGPEGPTETSIVKLDNGDLLAVFRTGQTFPSTDVNLTGPSIFHTRSSDDGLTWDTPKMLGVSGSFPLIKKLDNGEVAMTYGRYGAKVMFADVTGTRWSEPTIIYNGPGSGHTEMRRLSDGRYAYVYDQSGFYPPPWNNSVPSGYVFDNDQSANLISAILDINPVTVVEDYPWLLEYHGDVTPNSLPDPWSVTSSGALSVHLWAELGQDYIRLDTGANGPTTNITYSLDGTNPATTWSNIDFSDGAVIDLRARVGSASTSEAAASVLVGDGQNGFIVLELTGNHVALEGLNGNAGQVNYAPGGFSTLDWHNFRLIIEPDASMGGQVLASLFLDDDLVTPILTQQLMPSAVDEITFGDLTGSNNGILEIDFLRFAALPGLLPGDADGDGDVDLDDFNILASNFGDATGNGAADGDFDGDGDVDLDDFNILASSFGAGGGSETPAGLPEPASLPLLLFACVAALRRRTA